MPYQGSNAEWMNKQNVYDMLCRMQENLREYNIKVPCILDLLDEQHGSDCEDCEQCLADWLARERRNT